MESNILEEYYRKTEMKNIKLDNNIAEEIIKKLEEIGLFKEFFEDPLDVLLYNYFILKAEGKSNILDEIFSKYHIRYTSSIHNAIYDLLLGMENRSVLWPFVINFEKDNSLYKLNTEFGTITVYKASELFKNSKSSYIFEKKLRFHCFDRTFDFLKENRDYRAVLSYDNNMFVGGHFHAYLEKDDVTLDIASNALYKNKEEKDKVLKGEIIKKLTYDEVIDSINKVSEEVPGETDNIAKLGVLALYYAKKKGIK